MKHYAKAVVDESTGEIKHIAISDGPLSNDMVGTDSLGGRLHSFEFDTEDGSFVRAKNALGVMGLSGNTPSEKISKMEITSSDRNIKSIRRSQ